MAFLSVLIGVVLQHVLGLCSRSYARLGFKSVFIWLDKHSQNPESLQGYAGALQYLFLPVLGIGVIFLLVEHLFGHFAYFVLATLWLWLCLEMPARGVTKPSLQKSDAADAALFLNHAYRQVFAYLFWFSVFGPVGLALYYVTQQVLEHRVGSQDLVTTRLLWIQGILDWVPIRLLGLTYALVGEFAQTFKLWLSEWRADLEASQSLPGQYALTALGGQLDFHEAVLLVVRSIWVWIVVLALVSVGMLLS